MQLADGAEFELGMTVFYPEARGSIRRIETGAESHEIDSFDYQGERRHCLGLKGTACSTDLLTMYSSHAGAIDSIIGQKLIVVAELQAEIAQLEAFKKLGS